VRAFWHSGQVPLWQNLRTVSVSERHHLRFSVSDTIAHNASHSALSVGVRQLRRPLSSKHPAPTS
jgi:hypothetical protein